jgi:deoxyribodipyrimidine photo-lyase
MWFRRDLRLAYNPALRGVSGVEARFVHRPWDDPAGAPVGYPPPIVDHAGERRDALRRYDAVRGS